MSCPICGMPPLDGEPCCTREFAKNVVRAADAENRRLRAELARKDAEMREARARIAELEEADRRMRTACREQTPEERAFLERTP